MSRPTDPSSWEKYFDGWPVGAFLVLCAVLTALFVTPIPIGTADLPLPRIDRPAQLSSLQRERRRAMEALRGLPSPVERVAVALRRTGSHDAKASPSQVEHKQLRRLTKVARDRFGDEPLLQLRALQTHQFLRASRTLISADPPTPATNNLESLGGQLVRHGRVRGWFSEQGFLGDERTAAVLFQIHWSRATGLIDTHPFAPDVNDWKIYYRFLLSAPVNSDVDPRTDARWKLQQVAQLQRHDAGYPWLLAQGILLRRANQPAKATVALLAHRKRHPEGDWSLLARNQLAASARGLGP